MKPWMVLTAAVLIEIHAAPAACYETPTHAEITQKVIDQSVLSHEPGFLEDLGIDRNLEDPAFPSLVPTDEEYPTPYDTFYMLNAPIRRIIAGGAVLEDGSTNSLHHFFDPLHGRGLSMETPLFATPLGFSSPGWILGGKADDGPSPFTQDFSYADTAGYLYQALTSPRQALRDTYFGLMFRGLGHLVHHIQDMAQPQHVRNDIHCDKEASRLCSASDNPSHFEKYTDKHRTVIVTGVVPGNIPAYSTARDYWVNGEGTGMAEYTLSNFVSQGTNFELDSTGGLAGNSRYPLPAPVADRFFYTRDLAGLLKESTVEEDEAKSILSSLDCRLPLVCEMDFIASHVIDRAGDITLNPRASSLSLLDDELRRRDLRAGLTVAYNRFNFHSAYPYLMPRAIAYSAGLINHFFRGRLEILGTDMVDGESVSIEVKNASAPGIILGGGRFELFYDAHGGERLPAGPLLVSQGGLPLDPGASIRLTANLHGDLDADRARPFMLVFNALEGTVGAEPGIAAVNFSMRFRGKVQTLARNAGNCPGKVYAVLISFDQAPGGTGGRMILRGEASGAVYDFRAVPADTPVVQGGSQWSHGLDPFSGRYVYLVTYRYDGSLPDPCFAPGLGDWIEGETVLARHTDMDE